MKLLFVNVPWMKYYSGEGDEEKIVPSCGYSFQSVNGFYYGYIDELSEIPVEQFEDVSPDAVKADNVTVVWTAKNKQGQNKVIGWYKNAEVYRHVIEKLTLESERVIFKYNLKAPEKDCILLPVELRQLDAKEMEEGIYFEEDVEVLKAITMYMHNYDGDQMNYVFKQKDIEGQSILNFSDYEMYFAKADEFLEKDLYGKAVRLFNKAIAVEPEITVGYEYKGSIFLSLKMYDEALKVYEQVLSLEPENKGALYCVGLIYGLLGKYEACIEYLNKYLLENKNDVDAIAERGIAYYNLGQIEFALKDIKKARKKQPDNQIFSQLLSYIQEKA